MSLKKIFSLLFLFQTPFLYSQTDTTIYSLKGFEDQQGNTQLVYNTKYSSFSIDVDSSLFTYNIYNVQNGFDELFNEGHRIDYYPSNYVQSQYISDIEFFNNDPGKYIYSTNRSGIDGDCSISRYDSSNTFGGLGYIKDIYISPKDSNIVYALFGDLLIKSFDGGITWNWNEGSEFSPDDPSIQFLIFSPFDEAIIFGVNSSNHLVKSLDTGKTFFEVATISDWNSETKLYFDNDEKHIYGVINKFENNYPSSLLYISDNEGNPYSWELETIEDNHMSLCIDDSISGNVFMSVGNAIYESKDYGSSFTQFSELPHHSIGMYKKPKENILFAATSNGIVKVQPDTNNYVIRKSIKKSLEMYPLAVGNKWIYNDKGESYDIFYPEPFDNDYSQEITKDSTLANGHHYYYLESEPYGRSYWIRIDSLTGDVYETYTNNDAEEYLLTNLASSSGDEIETTEGIIYNVIETDTLLWNRKRYSKIYMLYSLFTYEQTFAQGIGIIKKLNEFDFGYSTTTLKGCIINGVVYGDTTVVGVEKIDLDLPTNFSLSQNYPNPFNPSTTINYSIPSSSVMLNSFQHQNNETPKQATPTGRQVRGDNVKLTVYDLLGREVATLVNKVQSPGNYSVQFDAGHLSSGLYFYRLITDGFTSTKKMLLLR